jgi:acyl-CoA synthetase (AMP-forming)/AMP-acid ligase II
MQIGSIIRRAALQYKDAPCITEGDRTLSFRDFDAATDRLGNALIAKGLNPGDRVAVLLPNSTECLIAYYAILKAGLVRVQLNVKETLDTHLHKLDASQSRCVIHDGTEGLSTEIQIQLPELLEMIANGEDKPCAVDRDLDAPLRFAFTGGTTGKSKVVVLTTRTDLVEINVFLADLIPELAEGEIFLHGAPIAHAGGAYFLPSIIRGVHSVMMTKFDTTEYLKLAEQTQASYSFLVPTMLAMILDDPVCNQVKTCFKIISYGGSSISPNVMKRGEERFGRVFAQCYGQAESPMAITYLRPEHHDRVGSCGRPFSVVEVAIFDDDDNRLPPGERGEIVCRGPQTMAGYWQMPEKTAEAFRNGWLHTGDIGIMDEDGFFYIVDRKNDMLISGGYNIYPREVEDGLMDYPGVSEVAVVGLPDEKWGDRVVAVVAGTGDLDPEAIMEFARGKLSSVKRPKEIYVWDELPKSGANKILRRSVRDKLLEAAK